MRRAPTLVLTVALLAAAGCGSADEDTTPVACLNGPASYSQALESAPGRVRLDGEVPISDCLVPNQSTGDLTNLGTILVELATDLNAMASQDPGGDPPLQLGYLIGAVQRGAEDSEGIHAELARRLEAAALFSPAGKPPPPPFDQQYEKGFDAGSEQG